MKWYLKALTPLALCLLYGVTLVTAIMMSPDAKADPYTTTKCVLDATRTCDKCLCCRELNDQCCCLHVDKCTCPPGRQAGKSCCGD